VIDAEAWRQRMGFGGGERNTNSEVIAESYRRREEIELTPDRVIATPDVTHVRYKLNGRRPLVLDNRGRGEEPAVA
jgi:hypothetical protein